MYDKLLNVPEAILRAKNALNNTVVQSITAGLSYIKDIPPMKSTDFLSISSLPHLCVRAEALALIYNYTRKDKIPAKLRAIFETGNAFQDIIRDIGLADNSMLRGQWRCKQCDYVHGSTDGEFTVNSRGAKEATLEKRIGRPLKCNVEIEHYGECKSTEFEYIEEKVINEFLRLTGHPDGILENRRYDHVLEIKTTNDRRFKEAMKKPFKEHLEQAMMYCWILEKKGIVLLYFNKNNGDFFTREYSFNYRIVNEVIMRIKSLWAVVAEFEQTGKIEKLPPRICETEKDNRAFNCQMCGLCFFGEKNNEAN